MVLEEWRKNWNRETRKWAGSKTWYTGIENSNKKLNRNHVSERNKDMNQ